MRLEFTLTSKRGTRRALVAQADPAVTVGQVLAEWVADGDVVHAGQVPVDLDRPVAAGGLQSGADVGIDWPGEQTTWPLDGPALAVVGGAAAGAFVPLRAGSLVIGRAAPADAVIEDPTLSVRHVEVEWTGSGARVRDAGSTNGTMVRGAWL